MNDMPEHLPELPSGYVYAGIGKDLPDGMNGVGTLAYDNYNGRWFEYGICEAWAERNHYAVPTNSDLGRKILAERGKPSWDSAPSWAEWLAQDEDGDWWWFSTEPVVSADGVMWVHASSGAGENDFASDGHPNPNWRTTLERRPEPQMFVAEGGDGFDPFDLDGETAELDIDWRGPPDLIIPKDAAELMSVAGYAEALIETGYRIEWDSNGIRGWRE